MSAFSSYILSLSPDGYWRLGESSGPTAADSSGHGRNGTYTPNAGGTILYGQPGLVPADTAAKSIHVDGVGPSYVVVPADSTINTSGSFTIVGFIQDDISNGFGFVALAGTLVSTGTNAGWSLHTDGSWHLRFDLYSTTSGEFVNGSFTNGLRYATSLTDGTYMWAAVYDSVGATLTLYINGASVASAAVTVPYRPGSHDLWLANDPTGNFLVGHEQDVAYWASALSGATIANIWSQSQSPPPSASVSGGANITATGTVVARLPSPESLYTYKRQMVYVYNASGQFLDVWRDAPLLAGFKEGINQAPSPLRVKLPRQFDSFDEAGTAGARGSIAQGNIVQYWLFGPGLPTTGLLRYQGVIDGYQPQIDEKGEESLTVTITPFGAALGDQGLTSPQQFGTPGVSASYVDPCTMFRWFFTNNDPLTGQPYAYPLTLDVPSGSVSSSVTAQYNFSNQNIGPALSTTITLLHADSPNWFFRSNPDKTVTLAKAPVTAQHQFVLGQHLAAPQYAKDWMPLRNVVQALGDTTLAVTLQAGLTSGNVYSSLTTTPLPVQLVTGQQLYLNPNGSNAQVVVVNGTAAAGATSIPVSTFTAGSTFGVGTLTTIAIQGLVHGSDLGTFGKRLYQLVDSRITDQAIANLLATATLAELDQMLIRTKVRLIDYRGDANVGLGYDIESIRVGDTCQIINPYGVTNTSLWDQAVWDTNVWDYAPGAALNLVVQIVGLTYGFDYVDLELAQFAPAQQRSVLQLQQDLLQYVLA